MFCFLNTEKNLFSSIRIICLAGFIYWRGISVDMIHRFKKWWGFHHPVTTAIIQRHLTASAVIPSCGSDSILFSQESKIFNNQGFSGAMFSDLLQTNKGCSSSFWWSMAHCFTSVCSLANNSIICGLRIHKNVCFVFTLSIDKNIIIKAKEVTDTWLLHPKIILQNTANQKSNASSSNYLLLNPI